MGPRHFLAPLLPCVLFVSLLVSASEQSVATTWRLLDYIAVDYREAVEEGVIVNQLEYDEMLEFSSTVSASIKNLPETKVLSELRDRANSLQHSIQEKASPHKMATDARLLAAMLIAEYPIPVKPTTPPKYERGKVLYAQLCSSCHGDTGSGNGPASEGLDPPPIDFTNQARANERSIFALYQVIDQGLEGSSMIGYASLPVEDRWALATYVGAMAFPESQAESGRLLLELDPALAISLNMDRYINDTPETLIKELGQIRAESVIAYLRRNPEIIPASSIESSLTTARALLKRSMSAYRGGDTMLAKDLALAAYLDGFEPVEPLLAARDNSLMMKIEAAMARVRMGIGKNLSPNDMQIQIDVLDNLFTEAQEIISQQNTSVVASFVAAFAILLREGLEALLIVVAIIALLRKAEQFELLPWVHAGWLSALIAGVATWALATWVITIGGASRELTEGLGSLIAAILLVWVGIWMHGKSHADAWQHYVHEKMGQALSKKSGVFLFGMVFVVVYREVFETILFFAALWNQGTRGSVVAGGFSAAFGLVILAWIMMRYSRRLPMTEFFKYSSWVIAVLAVILTGKAVSALQEAGYLDITWFDWGLRIEMLGLYPTLQGVTAQIIVAMLLISGFILSRRSNQSTAAAK